MKKIYSILIIAAVLSSCGGGSKKSVDDVIADGELESIRTKRQEIATEFDAINADLKKLDEAISKLDTVAKLSLVTTFQVQDTLFNHYVELQGSVNTKQNLVINAEYSGTLVSVFVKEGQKVSKGQLLARIDDGGLSAQLAQMEVQTELAKTTFERQKRLWEQKIGSEIQYLQAKTTYESNVNAVSQLKSQIAKANVTAPFSGTIDDVIADQGSNVAPGAPLIRIVNLNDMFIEAEVPEKYLPNISKGTRVLAYFPVLHDTVDTKVRQVSDYINPNNRSFKIEIDVPNHKGLIKPNLTAKVNINDYTSEKALLVPQSVISENAEGEQYVYVTGVIGQDSIADAHRTIITTGKTQGDFVEVLSGIKSGDHVIKEGARSVQEGQKVKIITQ